MQQMTIQIKFGIIHPVRVIQIQRYLDDALPEAACRLNAVRHMGTQGLPVQRMSVFGRLEKVDATRVHRAGFCFQIEK